MEPRASLSAFAFAILLGIVALALRGLTHEATALATGFGLYGAVLDLSYIVRRHRRRKLVLGHRRYLDWIVRGQWLSLLVIGTLAAQLLNSNEVRPWSDAAPGVRALVVGWTVLWSVTYASSLVDWYWILPKVSGIVSPPPCTVAGGKTFDRMTGVWLFHRGAATALVTFTLAAVPAWIAGTVNDNDSARTLLTLLSAALAIGFNAANAGTSWAFKQFINPQLVVGWYLRVRKDVNDPSRKTPTSSTSPSTG
jgi:hypothetical protein